MRGRKPKQESRSAEFRWRLIAWKQSPQSSRPSLRALARELSTSHQLLKHYLDGLERWQHQERYRKATKEAEEIRARANAEGRPMTYWEEQQVHACTLAAIRGWGTAALLAELEGLKREAQRGPLKRHQIKMLNIFVRYRYPGAQELLQQCSQSSVKHRKNNLPAISARTAKSFRIA